MPAISAACWMGNAELAGPTTFQARTSMVAAVAHELTSCGDARGALHRELFERLREAPLARDVSAVALSVGFEIAGFTPTPHALNMTTSDDGDVLFTLFGRQGREAEVWVSPGGSGHVTYVLTRGDEIIDGTLAATRVSEIADWLQSGTVPA